MKAKYSLILVVIVGGCAAQDPFNRPGTWAPLGNNDANLRVMVADPNDLSTGVDGSGSLSAEASPAVKRLLAGHRRPIPVINASQIDSGNAVPVEPATGAGVGPGQ
jgi:hypothetical protein